MPHLAPVGWYDGRTKAFVQIDKGEIEAAFEMRPQKVRAEALEGFMILTPRDGPRFAGHRDYYLEDD